MRDMKIEIDQKKIQYKIIFTKNIIQEIKSFIDINKAIIITDSNVNDLYGNDIYDKLISKYNNIYKLTFPAGESSKSIENLEEIYSFLLNKNFNRDDYIIALGGGVIGDLSGLAASTYKRGINLIQIPTTLLSQVDSSIGGKTAVNFESIKNIIGSFYNPGLVLINTNFLDTLTDREFLNGLAEVIKTSIIGDQKLFNLLKNNNLDQIKNNNELLENIIYKSILYKKDIVQKDFYDKSIRRVLNFGHTVGHVFEAHKDLDYKHGEAVCLGIKFASLFSAYKNLLTDREYDKIIKVIDSFGLPVVLEKHIDFEEIMSSLLHDKKVSEDKLNMVLLDGLFNPKVTEVTKDEIKTVWEWFNEKNSSD
ncbi:MAG: 3-dehydroquinate synthase [Halanaerobiales bacterium]|nr:3-dehydroquinate synthase [Halanaerobiales bacterium]